MSLNYFRYTIIYKIIEYLYFSSASFTYTYFTGTNVSWKSIPSNRIWLEKRSSADLLLPSETSLQLAPAEIVKLISCGCKIAYGSAWGCRKAGKICLRVSCLSAALIPDESEDVDGLEIGQQCLYASSSVIYINSASWLWFLRTLSTDHG